MSHDFGVMARRQLGCVKMWELYATLETVALNCIALIEVSGASTYETWQTNRLVAS